MLTCPRCLLGVLQGGFIPDVILYLSYFYTKHELPIRLAWFWVSNYMAQLLCAFIGTGILRMGGLHGVAGWRYLFLIEGAVTLAAGIGSFFLMPAGPTQTRTWWCPQGWFTERCVVRCQAIVYVTDVFRFREEKIMVNRYALHHLALSHVDPL